MLLKCWSECPQDRPSFKEISEFIGALLSKDADAASEAECCYMRNVTCDIPDDYLMSRESTDSDGYILVESPELLININNQVAVHRATNYSHKTQAKLNDDYFTP